MMEDFIVLLNTFGDEAGFMNASKFKCTHFISANGTTIVNGISGTKYATYINANIDGVTSLATFKTWLAEQYANGTPVEVVSKLAEEQTEDFTEEQKTAYPEWKKARTYKNVTHISSEDETPANVEVEYVQDNRTLYEDLKNAIISLGGNV